MSTDRREQETEADEYDISTNPEEAKDGTPEDVPKKIKEIEQELGVTIDLNEDGGISTVNGKPFTVQVHSNQGKTAIITAVREFLGEGDVETSKDESGSGAGTDNSEVQSKSPTKDGAKKGLSEGSKARKDGSDSDGKHRDSDPLADSKHQFFLGGNRGNSQEDEVLAAIKTGDALFLVDGATVNDVSDEMWNHVRDNHGNNFGLHATTGEFEGKKFDARKRDDWIMGDDKWSLLKHTKLPDDELNAAYLRSVFKSGKVKHDWVIMPEKGQSREEALLEELKSEILKGVPKRVLVSKVTGFKPSPKDKDTETVTADELGELYEKALRT
jgi:hypothetical protein